MATTQTPIPIPPITLIYKSYRQTPAYANFMRAVGWQTESQANTAPYCFIKHLGPVSICKLQRVRVAELDWEWIGWVQRKHRVVTTYLEPMDAETGVPESFLTAADMMIPAKTRIINLGKPLPKLRLEMKSKTRYNLGLAQRKKLIIEKIWGTELILDDQLFAGYYRLLADNAKRVGMLLLSQEWIRKQLAAFGKDATVALIRGANNQVLAVATYYCSEDAIFYTHNGSTEDGRQLMAPTLAIWAGIEEGMNRKKRIFDFDGVYDERQPKPRWLGYTRFKAGFGGSDHYFKLMHKQYRWPF